MKGMEAAIGIEPMDKGFADLKPPHALSSAIHSEPPSKNLQVSSLLSNLPANAGRGHRIEHNFQAHLTTGAQPSSHIASYALAQSARIIAPNRCQATGIASNLPGR